MNEYEIAFMCNLITPIVWVLAYFLCWGCQWVWAWMDDSEMDDNNALVKFIALRSGYEMNNSYSHPYIKKGNKDDGVSPFFGAAGCTMLMPWIIIFYAFGLFIVGVIGLAFITRLALRQNKILAKHINDKDLHQ